MKRLKNQSGFSLAETLLAVMILLLVSVIVATGMPAVRNAYEKVVVASNAQAMLSTAVTALRDELGTAWDVKSVKDAGGAPTIIEYFNANIGAKSRIALDAGDGTWPAITLQEYIPLNDAQDLIHDSTAQEGTARHLVPDANASLYVTYTTIEADAPNNIVKVNGLKVCLKKGNSEIYALKDDTGTAIPLEIRVLSKDIATD